MSSLVFSFWGSFVCTVIPYWVALDVCIAPCCFSIIILLWLGYHIEKELRYPEVESAVMTQYNIDIVFKTGKRYTIWFRDIDFSHISVPLYVKGYRVKSNYYHALYAVIAEVSYYTRGLSKEINRDYLLNTKELAKFYVNRDLDIIIKSLIKAAGGVEQSS